MENKLVVIKEMIGVLLDEKKYKELENPNKRRIKSTAKTRYRK